VRRRLPLFTLALALGCGGAHRSPPPPPAVDTAFFPFYPGSIWQYEEIVDDNHIFTGTHHWDLTATVRVLDIDASTGLPQLLVSSSVNCTNHRSFVRQAAPGRVEVSGNGTGWSYIFDANGGSPTSVANLLSPLGAGYLNRGPTIMVQSPKPTSTPVGDFPNAVYAAVPFDGAGAQSAVWDRTIGLLTEYSNVYVAGSGGSTYNYLLEGYDIAAPTGHLRAGALPSDAIPPAAPQNVAAGRTSASAVKVTWSDCSINEASFVVERRRDGETDFSAIASVPADTVELDDDLAGPGACTYRVRAQNAGGSAYGADVSVLAYGIPPAPHVALINDNPAMPNLLDYIGLSVDWPPYMMPVNMYVIAWSSDGTTWQELPPTTYQYGDNLYYDSSGKVTLVVTTAIRWPSGTYHFKVRLPATGSQYSSESTVSVP
jgi:hypothetical protein